jgi:ATP-binding cassette subfamily F protein 3
LLDAIKGFPGTVMMVSHDRHFLRALANRVFEVDRQEIRIYDMGWDDYIAWRARSAN